MLTQRQGNTLITLCAVSISGILYRTSICSKSQKMLDLSEIVLDID